MTRYTVTVHNQSNSAWKFYIYQQPPELTRDLTLAWLVSNLEIKPGQTYAFNWTTDYSFVWSETGTLQPGVTFTASGQKPCDPTGNNFTTFSYDGNTAGFTDPIAKGQKGSLFIQDTAGVPENVFSIGVGMSGKGTYVVNAQPQITEIFTPIPKYYVVAATDIVEGQVMDITSIGSAGLVKFPNNITSVTAKFTQDNSWDITSP